MSEALLDRRPLVRQAMRLEYFTIAWNSVEGLLAVAAGVMAGSISLVGFGLDSFIELTSGAALLWRMHHDADTARREHAERISLKVVGGCFLGLAIYIAYEAVRDLLSRQAPEHSLAGIVLACVSLCVMPLLARAKRRIGAAMHSHAMEADARQTDFCMYLSVILLAGLLLNALWGMWWADPVAALVMAPIIAREGVEGLRGEACHCAG